MQKCKARDKIFKVVQACYPLIKLYIHSPTSKVGALLFLSQKNNEFLKVESKPLQLLQEQLNNSTKKFFTTHPLTYS